MKNIAAKWWIISIVVLIGGLFGWSKLLQSSDPGVIAQKGIHWHPRLEIYIKGEKIEIPENIGIGAVHQPVHTHDDLPIIHLEFGGVVREKDLELGNFFRNWGKDMRSFGNNMRMTVNGAESTEFGDYMMRDGDKIELHYE
ncbi:hypothetical protein A3A39_01075 [Candidatus Kaiserbacteria bacterium RIFCSPLOWO2_01_FULL_54_13]|uniref:Uncharacterized protein n=1 Tax=Candidatus Kaiserbacteria bacterium RIFCSPLOWO2_01_FULL_54_13 TaxID=1798512 RepID=A0A1F6F270_9BACT|nr:MAG: hypothetical protein A3A39_01075 [Candidatus Kaiserbacteria bacterium RIFCSPLOWO2_01_FULL_54_13]